MKRNGFTVLELIVVLAIIVLLAAVLLPTLLKPTPAYRAQCQSNLKQLGLAIFQYQQDWNNKFPLVDVNDAAIRSHLKKDMLKLAAWQLNIRTLTRSLAVKNSATSSGS